MGCGVHTSGKCRPSLTEEMILNEDYLPGTMKGWRRYRIEYGFECSCPEGVVYLPPHVNADEFEDLLLKWADHD
jgi:hypothetical protein